MASAEVEEEATGEGGEIGAGAERGWTTEIEIEQDSEVFPGCFVCLLSLHYLVIYFNNFSQNKAFTSNPVSI